MNELESRIFQVRDNDAFQALALEVFEFQYRHVSVYRDYVDLLGRPKPTELSEIPFLPIRFFKSHRVLAEGYVPELHFMSSGTQGTRSNHFVARSELYVQAFMHGYRQLIGNPEEQVILALLPNYLEQGNSSLVYMVDSLIKKGGHPLSGFFLHNLEDLIQRYHAAVSAGKEVILFGVSYALLDLSTLRPDLSAARIIETGGMKGRREEWTKSQLHTHLKAGLNCSFISSEYGMTELLSQAYSERDGVFHTSDTMRILIRDSNDPFSDVAEGKTGGINVADLANLYSCSFIETQDLGRYEADGFRILGRMDLSDQRGCNLMVE